MPDESKLIPVFTDAVQSKEFFDRLLTDFDRAIEKYNLSPSERDFLKDILDNGGNVDLDVRGFIQAIHAAGGLGKFPSWLGFHWLGPIRPR